ncbi:MAG: DUF5681 domain-containing protein, partial [Alphaproteobacteria bacterium]
SLNRSTVIRKVLDESVPAQLGGRRKKIPTSEAAIRTLVHKALKDRDLGAIRDILQLWAETEEAAQSAKEAEYPFSDSDREVISEVHARLIACRVTAGS